MPFCVMDHFPKLRISKIVLSSSPRASARPPPSPFLSGTTAPPALGPASSESSVILPIFFALHQTPGSEIQLLLLPPAFPAWGSYSWTYTPVSAEVVYTTASIMWLPPSRTSSEFPGPWELVPASQCSVSSKLIFFCLSSILSVLWPSPSFRSSCWLSSPSLPCRSIWAQSMPCFPRRLSFNPC